MLQSVTPLGSFGYMVVIWYNWYNVLWYDVGEWDYIIPVRHYLIGEIDKLIICYILLIRFLFYLKWHNCQVVITISQFGLTIMPPFLFYTIVVTPGSMGLHIQGVGKAWTTNQPFAWLLGGHGLLIQTVRS